LEAQLSSITKFAEAEGFEVTAKFVEVESGKGSDAMSRRPQLAAALAEARKHKNPRDRGKVGSPKPRRTFYQRPHGATPFIEAELALMQIRLCSTSM
jgi:hypothetical protein